MGPPPRKQQRKPLNKRVTKTAKTPIYRRPEETIEINEIKEPGRVWCGINVTVLSVTPFTTKTGDDAVRFVFGNGKLKRITGVAKNEVAIELIDKLKENEKYRIQGVIYANQKNKSFASKSNTKYDLSLTNVQEIQKLRKNCASASGRSSHQSLSKFSLDSLKQKLGKVRKKCVEDIKDVIIENGTVYRYMGCEECNTSIRIPEKNGKYFCSKCPKKSGEKQRKICMMIKDIKVRDESGKVRNIVAFDKVTTHLLGKSGKEFLYDFQAQQAFDTFIGAKINAEISIKPTRKGLQELKLILNSITVVIPASPPTQDDDIWEDGPSSNSQDAVKPPTQEELTAVELSRSVENIRIRRDKYDYKLNSEPCGLVLLINNNHFPNRLTEKTRTGSEKDVQNIKDVFQGLGFEIFKEGFTDVKSYELFNIVSDFQEELQARALDSSVVVIMSHGSHFNIDFVDGKFKNLYEDVIYKFSETNFPEFMGKPKLFIIQACQDFPTEVESRSFLKIPANYTDILVCFPCLPGYSAYRHNKEGSIFIKELCQEIRSSAYELNFLEIIKQVQRNLKSYASNGMKKSQQKHQMNWYQDMLFGQFYFNMQSQLKMQNPFQIS